MKSLLVIWDDKKDYLNSEKANPEMTKYCSME